MKRYSSRRLFSGRISFLIDKHAGKKMAVLLLLLFLLLTASAALGDIKLSLPAVFHTFIGGGTDFDQLVVYSFRMPRMVVALLAGMALAAAGAILQGLVRNPLASPDIIGLTAGASAAVVGFLTIFSNESNALTVSIQWLPLAAFFGAAVAALAIYLFAWKNGVSPVRLVLIGIGVAALMQAIKTMLMILGPIHQAAKANIWLTGTVNGASWKDVAVLAPWTIVLLAAAFLAARHVNIQELGDELAVNAGARVEWQRLLLIILATGLVGGAVAFAGGIGFVGLMAPHMARRLVGSAFGALLPASALIGAMLVMAADLAGRTLFLPLEVPAGVFTAGIGAPYFIYLLFRMK
ncbi:iron chelate uptake ABC transporter family permease subunit [Bacillus aerolatus]|uniref:Iron chelate uptake ABC transporter family permease subunit n=1 Tax=Bacillus aerolatus TaxID=2653354 RepID=A0A6I1FVN9_9BACI|nr:iron ABC transporter permease [Bacillus aerolatus]KAB7707031.1 iron chelate uptake ABC transporter family permease subunit [Bacillus aerolatus]